MSVLELRGEHPGAMRFWAFKNIGICAWSGQATQTAMQIVIQSVEGLLTSRTESCSYIHMIAHGVPLPEAAARSAMIELMRRQEARTACAAIVIYGAGFWTSAMRSAVTGIRVLVPRSFDYRIHGSVAEVLEWFPKQHARRTGVDVSVGELEVALMQVQSWLAV